MPAMEWIARQRNEMFTTYIPKPPRRGFIATKARAQYGHLRPAPQSIVFQRADNLFIDGKANQIVFDQINKATDTIHTVDEWMAYIYSFRVHRQITNHPIFGQYRQARRTVFLAYPEIITPFISHGMAVTKGLDPCQLHKDIHDGKYDNLVNTVSSVDIQTQLDHWVSCMPTHPDVVSQWQLSDDLELILMPPEVP